MALWWPTVGSGKQRKAVQKDCWIWMIQKQKYCRKNHLDWAGVFEKKEAFFVCLFWQIAVCFQTLGKSVKYMEKIAKYIPRYMACILKWQRWRCGEAETCQAQTWKIMEPWTEGVNPNVGYSTTTGRQCEHWTSTGCKEEKNIKWKTESGLCVGDQSGWSHPSLSFDLVKGVTAVWNTNHGPAHNSLHPPS